MLCRPVLAGKALHRAPLCEPVHQPLTARYLRGRGCASASRCSQLVCLGLGAWRACTRAASGNTNAGGGVFLMSWSCCKHCSCHTLQTRQAVRTERTALRAQGTSGTPCWTRMCFPRTRAATRLWPRRCCSTSCCGRRYSPACSSRSSTCCRRASCMTVKLT